VQINEVKIYQFQAKETSSTPQCVHFLFLPRDALVHSAVLRLHVVRPSVCPSVRPSVCNVGGSESHRLEILETKCTDT